MAHKKAGGSTDNTRDSNAQRLGVKIFGGQLATPGSIIVRQRGTQYRAGKNVMSGKDRSLFSRIEGIVKFTTRRVKRYDGRLQKTRYVHVVPKDVSEKEAVKK